MLLDVPFASFLQVEATDEDSSSNGQIVYSLYYAQSESRKPFVIDKLTGVLTPSPHVIFDRETRPREDVTVKVGEYFCFIFIAFFLRFFSLGEGVIEK